jgi:hypothetical protein
VQQTAQRIPLAKSVQGLGEQRRRVRLLRVDLAQASGGLACGNELAALDLQLGLGQQRRPFDLR